MNDETLGFETLAIHAGQEPDALTGAVVTPIHLSTTFAQKAVGEHAGFEYSRTGNPTRASSLNVSVVSSLVQRRAAHVDVRFFGKQGLPSTCVSKK